MYNELIFHLDLCILAYHQYTQALAFPFDPYYEHMAATGTSRRDTFMVEIRREFARRARYHGPGDTQGWAANDALDPIVQRYDRLYPWHPAFCNPEASWILYKVPGAIVDQIAEVHMCSYQAGATDPNGFRGPVQTERVTTKPGGGGRDILYGFEGGTGKIDRTPASWSHMGCVLDRTNDAGGYDVHIAFRGSRSGSGGRAMSQGAAGKGNPDWVTDMDVVTKVADTAFATHGQPSRGFSRAVKTCMPTVLAALHDIQRRRGAPPHNIYVTGHSLGGALATHFAAAVVVGKTWGPNGGGNDMPASLRAWPWRHLRLITFSAPIPGNFDFQAEFNSKVYCRRVWLGEDPITTENVGWHIGSAVWLTMTSSNILYYAKKPPIIGSISGAIGAAATLGHHEPKAVRDTLYKLVQSWGEPVDGVPGKAPTDIDFPWKDGYASFGAMVSSNERAVDRETLRTVLAGFDDDLRSYMNAFAQTMSKSAAYKTYFVSSDSQQKRRDATLGEAARLGSTSREAAHDAVRKLAARAKTFVEAYDGMGKHVTFAVILAEYLQSREQRFPLKGLLAQPTLEPYLI